MRPYFYQAYPVPYWYNPYIPMVKYADASWWQNAAPYLQAAGIGGGIGALGGAGVGALMGRGDWKKALKSALIGMVAGAVVGSAAYAGYRALFPASTPAPAPAPTPTPAQVLGAGQPGHILTVREAKNILETKHPGAFEEYVGMGMPDDPRVLQDLIRRYFNVDAYVVP
jgi:hypothetical protein